jgi:hypothetical protein
MDQAQVYQSMINNNHQEMLAN